MRNFSQRNFSQSTQRCTKTAERHCCHSAGIVSVKGIRHRPSASETPFIIWHDIDFRVALLCRHLLIPSEFLHVFYFYWTKIADFVQYTKLFGQKVHLFSKNRHNLRVSVNKKSAERLSLATPLKLR